MGFLWHLDRSLCLDRSMDDYQCKINCAVRFNETAGDTFSNTQIHSISINPLWSCSEFKLGFYSLKQWELELIFVCFEWTEIQYIVKCSFDWQLWNLRSIRLYFVQKEVWQEMEWVGQQYCDDYTLYTDMLMPFSKHCFSSTDKSIKQLGLFLMFHHRLYQPEADSYFKITSTSKYGPNSSVPSLPVYMYRHRCCWAATGEAVLYRSILRNWSQTGSST